MRLLNCVAVVSVFLTILSYAPRCWSVQLRRLGRSKIKGLECMMHVEYVKIASCLAMQNLVAWCQCANVGTTENPANSSFKENSSSNPLSRVSLALDVGPWGLAAC